MYKRQQLCNDCGSADDLFTRWERRKIQEQFIYTFLGNNSCLLYTSDAADERSSVDLGGRRIIKKKKYRTQSTPQLKKINMLQ